MQFLRCMWKLVLESCQWKNNSLYRILVTEPWKSLEDWGRGILSLWQFFRATRVGADSFLSGRVVEPAFKCANVDPTWREHGKLLPNPLSPEGERAQESGKKTSYQERGWIKTNGTGFELRSKMLRTENTFWRCPGHRTFKKMSVCGGIVCSCKVCSFIITSFQKLTGVPWELNQILHSALSAMTSSDHTRSHLSKSDTRDQCSHTEDLAPREPSGGTHTTRAYAATW